MKINDYFTGDNGGKSFIVEKLSRQMTQVKLKFVIVHTKLFLSHSEFDTSRMEMGAVADLFDRNGEGLIDWQEFIAALRPDWQERKPATDADKIHDEVKRLVMLCTCRQKFRVFQVGEGKYRVSLENFFEVKLNQLNRIFFV
jgi:hypothetical protein